MIFAIIEGDSVVASSDQEMYVLLTYISGSLLSNELYCEKIDGDYLYIYDNFDDPYEENPLVKIKNEKINELFKQLAEVKKNNPKKVFIKKEGENFIFEGSEYSPRKIDEVNLKSLNFDKIDIFNEPCSTFNGGFHCLPKEDNNYEIAKKYCYKKCLSAADIKFKNDFTVNHSLFYEKLSIDEIKQKIIESINDSSVTKYVEIEDKIFSFYGYSKGISILSIVNNKGEILTAFRLIEETR